MGSESVTEPTRERTPPLNDIDASSVCAELSSVHDLDTGSVPTETDSLQAETASVRLETASMRVERTSTYAAPSEVPSVRELPLRRSSRFKDKPPPFGHNFCLDEWRKYLDCHLDASPLEGLEITAWERAVAEREGGDAVYRIEADRREREKLERDSLFWQQVTRIKMREIKKTRKRAMKIGHGYSVKEMDEQSEALEHQADNFTFDERLNAMDVEGESDLEEDLELRKRQRELDAEVAAAAEEMHRIRGSLFEGLDEMCDGVKSKQKMKSRAQRFGPSRPTTERSFREIMDEPMSFAERESANIPREELVMRQMRRFRLAADAAHLRNQGVYGRIGNYDRGGGYSRRGGRGRGGRGRDARNDANGYYDNRNWYDHHSGYNNYNTNIAPTMNMQSWNDMQNYPNWGWMPGPRLNDVGRWMSQITNSRDSAYDYGSGSYRGPNEYGRSMHGLHGAQPTSGENPNNFRGYRREYRGGYSGGGYE